MNPPPRQVSLEELDAVVPRGCRSLRRHLADGNLRLERLRFDNSPAAVRLWDFLLSEEDRLEQARKRGFRLIGTMKDLGTVPVMAYSLPHCVAFYPDGAWWLPCLMEYSTPMLELASQSGISDSFCPVRAMIGAYVSRQHFPLPDINICSVGATCDDMSAVAQRLEHLGYPVMWWEIPARTAQRDGEPSVKLPGGFTATPGQVEFVKNELGRVKLALEKVAAHGLTDHMLAHGIRAANRIRRILRELRALVFTAPRSPLPALELQIAEMLAIHFCSDRGQTLSVLSALLDEVRRRVRDGQGFNGRSAVRTNARGPVRTYWVNPVADLRAMNLLEECGGRLCGSDFMFCHALETIPENVPPLEALALMALADPMAGPGMERARRIAAEVRRLGAEAVVVSRIPGASHCAFETESLKDALAESATPVMEIEIPPVIDPLIPALKTRLETLMNMAAARSRRRAAQQP